MTCPKCGAEMECDAVDVGVGTLHGAPYCPECGWVEVVDHVLAEQLELGDEDPDDPPF